MFFADILEIEGLGNRSYLAGGARAAVVVDPLRDIDQVIAAAARRGVRIVAVAETHVHNDYVSGGLELARLTGARYLVPAGASVAYARVPVADGDAEGIEEGLMLRAVATPGHTPHHTSYVLEEDGRAVAAFRGGSLLIGSVGRPDLVEPRLTERLARAQHASAHRLAAELDDEVAVMPTHGFGSFCPSTQADGEHSTIGAEKASNPALAQDVETFVKELLAGLDDVPAYYTHMAPANAAGPAPVDLTAPERADAGEIARRLAAGEWVVPQRPPGPLGPGRRHRRLGGGRPPGRTPGRGPHHLAHEPTGPPRRRLPGRHRLPRGLRLAARALAVRSRRRRTGLLRRDQHLRNGRRPGQAPPQPAPQEHSFLPGDPAAPGCLIEGRTPFANMLLPRCQHEGDACSTTPAPRPAMHRPTRRPR